MDACTIIARNYLAHARVLAESFREHHPGGSFTVLVIDDPGNGELGDEPFTVLSPYDIGIDRAEVHRMAFIYDIKEFATAVKPAILKHLLADADAVAYFDPDIEVFTPLEGLATLAREHGIVLTPHTTHPLPRDQLLPSEEMLLRAGIYNLGFIAVGRKAMPFLDWWAERLARDCLVAVEEGIFVDQRWIDFVPALFDHVIVREPGFNVAYWNLSHRPLEWTGTRYEIEGEPLRFFHYSGFSPDSMHLLSAHMGTLPRILLEDQPVVRRLCDDYARRLRDSGYGRDDDRSYRFDTLPNGLRIEGTMRRDVRTAILAAERDEERAAPDPFDPGTLDDFLGWLGEPVGKARLPRYLDALYRRRGELRGAFPDVAGSDRRRYLEWARTSEELNGAIAKEVLRHEIASGELKAAPAITGAVPGFRRARRLLTRGRPLAPRSQLVSVPGFPPLPGVNVVGYLRAELGVGEAARRLIAGLEAGGIPHSTVTYRRTESRQKHPFPEMSDTLAIYDTNVVCVNADEFPGFHAEASELFTRRYTIGVWFWEVSRFPRALHRSFDLVDEVWVGSRFVREAVAAQTRKPVRVVPLPIEAPSPHGLTRAAVGLPENFVFHFNFDFLSVLERKNPLGLIDAFTQAFAPDEGPVLVIKTINGDKDPVELARLRDYAAPRGDVRIVDGYVSARERDALMALCDCYVSLHRSEGYGLTIAEAMAAGKPVIATGYSGNLAFMNDENSLLVPYELTSIPEGCDPYPAGAEWAEPDIEAAAKLMRHVWEEPDIARALGRRAREDVLERHTPLRTAEFVARRLNELRDEREERSTRAVGAPLPGSPLLGGTAGGLTRLARRLLHRLLWPYFVEQQAFDEAAAASLRKHDVRRLSTLEPRPPAAEPPSGSVAQEHPVGEPVGAAPEPSVRR